MERLYWKRRSAGLGICVGLTAALFACSGDDSTVTQSDAGDNADASGGQDTSMTAEDSSSPDARTRQDSSSEKDSAPLDGSSADVTTTADAVADVVVNTDANTDAGADADADAGSIVTPPPPLALCDLFDSFWNDQTRSNSTSWPAVIINGPPPPDPDATLIGYTNVFDCTVGNVFTNGLNVDLAWVDQLTPFEYQFFGCADDAGADAAAIGFALVPPNMYGQPFSPDDLKKLGDWFVQSVIQAVANQSAVNPQAMLTGTQIDQIQAEMTYQETLYPNILGSGYTYSTCPDAGPDASGD
jgi:hypothetical protein